MRPVRGANTDAEEYAVWLADSRSALITRGSRSAQSLSWARRIATDSLDCSPVAFPLGHYRSLGSFTRAGGLALASALDTNRRAEIVRLSGNLAEPVSIELRPLPLRSDSWTSHPTLSADGQLLVVASDRPGGYGGLDLWYSVQRSNGQWDTLRNLGPEVNTPCDELSPFLTRDGTLLFSSSGHETVGGYDLFAAHLQRHGESVTVGTLEHLRPPINTEADEIFPSTPGDWESLLYWSSDRREQNFDLYVAEKLERPKAPPPAITEVEPQTPTARLRGRVRTADRLPAVGADVSVRDLERRRTVAQTQSDSTGAFELSVPTERELELVAESGSGFYDARRIRLRRSDTLVTLPDELTIPLVLTLRINFPHDQARVPYDFVLDSNGMQTNRRWTEELDRVAANILRYRDRIKRIVLVGHTDPNGSDQYNLQLGQRRVEFVIEELIKRGVPKELLEGISAGERQLLPRRPGEPSDQYYRRNRRVELSKVLH
uniref:OmpA family peptidoglycan-associated lipoprotein n=1 Tax=uncultured Bacteroidota bacterium TaxID=152509 RepID=H5SG22_9BACT|nr:OmpA family peptidoglycan-associated lipoprotein [uncultured Bacteroidetes bacterium]